MVDFGKLRQRKGSNFESLQKKLEQTGQNGGFKKDPRIWKPAANKDNISQNIIRFLPIPFVDMQSVEEGKLNEVDLTPVAKILKHFWQGAKGFFAENSLQTFGEDCPVTEFCIPLWKKQKETNDKALKDTLMQRFARASYYANVLVIKDGTNPENNGKVMLYEFGKSIYDILEKAQKPKFEDDLAFDPFDMWEGANLKLNLTYEKKKFGGRESLVPDFDSVKWDSPSQLAGGDEEEMDRIWKSEHSIAEFYDRKHFKTYDELKAKMNKVLGLSEDGKPTAPGSTISKNAEEMLRDMTSAEPKQEPVKEARKHEVKEDSVSDDLADFEKLLNS